MNRESLLISEHSTLVQEFTSWPESLEAVLTLSSDGARKPGGSEDPHSGRWWKKGPNSSRNGHVIVDMFLRWLEDFLFTKECPSIIKKFRNGYALWARAEDRCEITEWVLGNNGEDRGQVLCSSSEGRHRQISQ